MRKSARTHLDIGSQSPPSGRKKYVTRACDSCKKKKAKCDGYQPCQRCLSSRRNCAYQSSYLRVKRQRTQHDGEGCSEVLTNPPFRLPPTYSPLSPPTSNMNGSPALEIRQLPENDKEDLGDASAHAFLRRVYGHLNSMGQAVPRNLFRPIEKVLDEDPQGATFIFPDKLAATGYLDCFFEHCNATYRYIPKKQIYFYLDQIYTEDDNILKDDAKMAVLLLVMSLGCIWLSSWRNLSLAKCRSKAARLYQAAKPRLNRAATIYPPTLTILQGHALEFLLGMDIFNAAWMSLGVAVRLGQMVGIQKASSTFDDVEEYSRRGMFWTLFMIDRYLSAELGRPMAINDEDVTIPYPDPPKSHLDEELGSQEPRITPGVVAHIKLTRITGNILRRLYPVTKDKVEDKEDIVAGFERDMQSWLQETPRFFHPESENCEADESSFYDVPWIIQRQRRTVRSAYNFTTMLIYRGYLLEEFLHTNLGTSRYAPPAPRIMKCVKAALSMASIAGEIGSDLTYNAVYWTTSYFTFCAISILLVYLTLYRDAPDRPAIELVLEKAMVGHKKLDNSVYLPAQKLLEESNFIAPNAQSSPRPSISRVDNVTNVLDFSDQMVVEDLSQTDQPQQADERSDALRYFSDGEHGIFQELYGLGTFGAIEGMDMIMNIGFDTSNFNFLEQ